MSTTPVTAPTTESTGPVPATPVAELDIAVGGMTCASCVARVERKLNKLPGVTAVVNLALESARALGVALPNTATAQELFNSCAAHGGKAWDHSAMVRALEKMANFEIGQTAA